MIYSYTRVSTNNQVEEGFSLEVQEKDCGNYVNLHKLLPKNQKSVICFREEGVSGGIPLQDRKQGQLLLSILKKGDHLICSKLDRLFRSPLDCCENLEFFKKNEINIHFIDLGGCITNGVGELFVQIASSFAGYEKARIQERIKDVKRHKQENGEYQGGKVVFGYRVVKNRKGIKILKEDVEQQKIIRTIKRMYKNNVSMLEISQRISEKYSEHLPNNKISYTGVRRIIYKLRKKVEV